MKPVPRRLFLTLGYPLRGQPAGSSVARCIPSVTSLTYVTEHLRRTTQRSHRVMSSIHVTYPRDLAALLSQRMMSLYYDTEPRHRMTSLNSLTAQRARVECSVGPARSTVGPAGHYDCLPLTASCQAPGGQT